MIEFSETRDLFPVQMREIGGELIQTINARDVHRGLEVGRDYSTWIRYRIKRESSKKASTMSLIPT